MGFADVCSTIIGFPLLVSRYAYVGVCTLVNTSSSLDYRICSFFFVSNLKLRNTIGFFGFPKVDVLTCSMPFIF